MMVFLKEVFKKVDFEYNQQTTKKRAKFPSKQQVDIWFATSYLEFERWVGRYPPTSLLRIHDVN